ncbi:TonB-dependent receptor [Alteromonas sp. KUL49]|uniref:TonB-dependent receptor plug domain-containing protein n=1 Tax=Alteromonas sp. KUL49 TaxID=2480798 RepID=UPI00102F1C4D|nr:TonB-dependent receptor [Alteromonas sp. KUL49]TAP38713.1 TonB-dependent receptor [Alteromonas sp. KUL49]GEA12665.1 TonB-dependent receptor [Alteromonas sp. KUL49]
MKKNKLYTAIASVLTGLSLSCAVPVAFAQETETPDEANVEKIAVVGARGAPRSVTSSPVPVDVLSAEDLAAVASADMNDIMMTLVPSYTLSRQPISDGGTFIRPAQLRGLPTDKTLVLVNGKRRHRAALVQIGGSGTQGPDLATIPASALGSVEVLRDGAAAQYGSDAIAGVINFQLKNNAEGGTVTVDMGQYYEGDGTSYNISGNKGFTLGDDGWLSISAEINETDATLRGEQYCESWACVDPNDPRFLSGGSFDTTLAAYDEDEFIAGLASANIGFGDVVQPWGQPNYSAVKTFFNAGYALGSDMELYAYGNYMESEGDGSFFYRYPGNGTIEDLREIDGTIYSPLDKFPGGFTPRFFGEITDYSFATGLKGMSGDLGYDLSARYGYNEIDYTLSNTVNPSLGSASPTSFKPGSLANDEFQIQADFTYDLSEYIFAFGLSYMDESYEISPGDEASYSDGPHAYQDPFGLCSREDAYGFGLATDAQLATAIANGLDCDDANDPVYRTVGVGSNGFPGYGPLAVGTYSRDSVAIYGDVSGDITEDFFAQAAVRYEDYSDMGSELVYKVAGIYTLTEEVALRGSYGTGFRAPTPGQQGTTNISTRLPNGFPVATGLFPASGAVAQALGATDLKPETSTNITFGLTAEIDDLTLTIDYYRIALEDRFNAISTLDVSTDPDSGDAYSRYLALVDAGVDGANSIGGVFYFTNAFDSITQGVDVVATYSMESTYGDTVFTASMNYGTNKFDGAVDEDLFNAEAQFDFENANPETRGVFSVKHSYDDFSVLARLNYYGGYENADGGGTVSEIQEFGSEFIFDLEGTYYINETLTLSAGVRNLFDNYPDEDTIGEACCGRIYRSDSIVDWQGGFYYARLTANF